MVDGWIEFFSAGPTAIRDLEFTTRTPARLFDSLQGQTQLEKLTVKWGDYSDLSALEAMTRLDHLELRGATAVTSLEPLVALPGLRTLHIAGCKRLTDFSPLGRMPDLENLSVYFGMNGPYLHADSLEFLRGMRGLKRLQFAPVVDSRDYSPVLALQQAELVWVAPVKGMVPSQLDLEWSVPGVAAAIRRDLEEDVDPVDSTHLRREALTLNDDEQVQLLKEFDRAWSDLLDGRRPRLEVAAWSRQHVGWFGGLLRDAMDAFENLAGYPWEFPPDRDLMRIFSWLEDWRAAVREYERDPIGEPRREAMRSIVGLVASGSEFVRIHFDSYVERGVLGPDDESALGVPPADRDRPKG